MNELADALNEWLKTSEGLRFREAIAKRRYNEMLSRSAEFEPSDIEAMRQIWMNLQAAK